MLKHITDIRDEENKVSPPAAAQGAKDAEAAGRWVWSGAKQVQEDLKRGEKKQQERKASPGKLTVW